MTCANCGAELAAGTRFCPGCGAPVRQTTCSTCGAEVVGGARFCAACGAPVTDIGAPSPLEDRERKVVTLLFADLVGYTRLNESHDPEVIEGVVGTAFDRLSAEVDRYEGLVEKFAGDAMFAVFGVPAVHEDDPERAVRAALEMQHAMAELREHAERDGRPGLALRIGIETGEVLANPARARNERDRMVTGDAVNTAARLEQAAAPGEVVVGPATWAATRGAIEYAEMEPISLKGKALPVPAWRAVRVRAGRGGRRAKLGLEAPLIGRDEELTMLKETVRRTVVEGRPHLVTIQASAGVGKSRLAWELETYLDGLPDQYHWRKGRCLAYAQSSYSALADAIAADASVLDDEPGDTAAAKVSARLRELTDGDVPEGMEPALHAILGFDTAHGLSREDLFEAWRAYLELIARRAPLILVLEDIHWADEGLLDFIEFAARWTEAPVMILCLARHELLERRPAWGGGLPNASSIVLEPLSPQESTRLVGSLLGGALPAELERRVVDVADGNPLFAEELARLLVDRGDVRHTESGWEQAQPDEAIEIPQSIQALLAARLDSLPPNEKRLSQDAAVVGRIFWDRLLAHMAGQSPSATVGMLRSLRVKELVEPREPSSMSDAQEYAFRHVLVRDVAYDSIPKLERARKHREVARWAEEQLGDRADEVVELLAAHYWQALRYEEEFGTDDAAIADVRRRTLEHARAAGHRARDVSQLESATSWMRIAVEQARRLDLPPGDFAELVLDYVEVGQMHERYDLQQAALSEAIGRVATHEPLTIDERRLIARLRAAEAYGRFGASSAQDDAVAAITSDLREALAQLDGTGPSAERAALLHRLGWIAWRGGSVEESLDPLRQALEEARTVGDDGLVRLATHDLGIALNRLSTDPEGLRLLEESMRLAREANDVNLLSRCYINIAAVLIRFGRWEESVAIGEEGLARARRAGDRMAQAFLGFNLADWYAREGRLLEALPLHHEAIAAANAIGMRAGGGHDALATTLIHLGRFDEAREAWRVANEAEPVREPQDRADAAHLTAVFTWAQDPERAIRLLLDAVDTRQSGWPPYVFEILIHAGRMAMRIGDAESAAAAAAIARQPRPGEGFGIEGVAEAAINWADGLASSDHASGARSVASAAVVMEQRRLQIRAAEAYADAALLAERGGQPADAARWQQRAEEIYASCSAVPVLERIRESVGRS
jgi:class 3 adenylate cyclase/tetratricopeptide (TPR) repeat protein